MTPARSSRASPAIAPTACGSCCCFRSDPRDSIRIANAYFSPDDLILDALVDALKRGVRVEVIMPGEDIDAQMARSTGKARWEPMLQAGARFYEYAPARFHCKYMVVDDRWASVGSANMDNRSLSLNEEANLNVLSERFAAEQTRIFEDDKTRAREITLERWRNRPTYEKINGAVGSLAWSQM